VYCSKRATWPTKSSIFICGIVSDVGDLIWVRTVEIRGLLLQRIFGNSEKRPDCRKREGWRMSIAEDSTGLTDLLAGWCTRNEVSGQRKSSDPFT
jgi:hypothetical protein